MSFDENLLPFVMAIVMLVSFWLAWILWNFVLPQSESTMFLVIGSLICIFVATRAVVKKEMNR